MQVGEVLPCETGSSLGTAGDVLCEEGPGPRLWDTSLEPDRHGVQTTHLAENHLLTSLGGDGLSEQLSDLTRVEVVDETPDTTLSPAGQLLVEVDELTHVSVWVVVGALWGSGLAQHVTQECGVSLLLLCHELDQGDVLWSETSSSEVLLGEGCHGVVEGIQLDPLLVEAQSDGLVIEVALHHIAWKRAIGAETTCGSVGCWLRVLQQAIRVVVGGCWVRWQSADARCEDTVGNSAGDSGGTLEWAVSGCTSHIAGSLRSTVQWTGDRGGHSRNLRVWSKHAGDDGEGSGLLARVWGIGIDVAVNIARLIGGIAIAIATATATVTATGTATVCSRSGCCGYCCCCCL